MVVTTVTQTAFLNKALQLGDAMAVYPFFQAFWIGFGTIGTTVLYEITHTFTYIQWIVYVVATGLFLGGLFFLWKHNDQRTGKKRWRKALLKLRSKMSLERKTASADNILSSVSLSLEQDNNEPLLPQN